MSTPWLFSYSSLTTPEKFNIQPYYTISGLRMDTGTNTIYNFPSLQLSYLETGMLITLDGSPTLFGSRTLASIDLLNRTVTFDGLATTETTTNGTFNFQANPGYLTEVATSLTGQQVHNNFFSLAQGLTNHQERLLLIESSDLDTASPESGYVQYTGFEKTIGSFYGGSPLSLVAGTSYNTALVIDSTNPLTFNIAMDDSVATIPADSSFSEIEVSHGLGTGTTFSLAGVCTQINAMLINNGSTFQFESTVSLSSYTIGSPYNSNDWDDLSQNAGFNLRLDDSDTLVTFMFSDTERPANLSALVSLLNARFISAGISGKLTASTSDHGGGDVRLVLVGTNTRTGTNPGIFKAEITNVSTGTFLEDVLYINESIIFDYSTSLHAQADPTNTKVRIVGLDPAFRVVLMDGDTYPALSGVGFGVGQYPGTFISYHSALPSNSTYNLNFDGNFSATSMTATTGTFTNLSYTSLTGTTMYADTGQFESVEISSTFPLAALPAGYTRANYNLVDIGTAYFSSLDVSGAMNVEGAVLVEGAISLTGEATLSNNVVITNTLHDTADRTLYVGTLLSTGVLISGAAPDADNANDYLLYNGNFGAVSMDVTDSIGFHGVASVLPANGRLYGGNTVSPSGTSSYLNYNGHFRATSLTGTSSREMKTNISTSSLDALSILLDTLIVDYNFKGDLLTPKIGFIAEDTSSILSGLKKDGMDITNCIGAIIKSIQQLHEMIKG